MSIDSLMSAVVLHVPHSSTLIPEAVMDQFIVPGDVLKSELVRMTDHLTLELFGGVEHPGCVIAAEVNRLVVDVERFPDDADEQMAAKGMGAIYTRLADGGALRKTLSANERQRLLTDYYEPHHARFSAAVQNVLGAHGCCLIVDAHSFPSRPLPYEYDQSLSRPDICIGTDPFHTPPNVCRTFVECFEKQGFRVEVDRPFSGAIVPAIYYQKDNCVMSVMVEVNRLLYLDESTGMASVDFDGVANRVRNAVMNACEIVIEEIAR
jgi:N-formylglutamate deformylase